MLPFGQQTFSLIAPRFVSSFDILLLTLLGLYLKATPYVRLGHQCTVLCKNALLIQRKSEHCKFDDEPKYRLTPFADTWRALRRLMLLCMAFHQLKLWS